MKTIFFALAMIVTGTSVAEARTPIRPIDDKTVIASYAVAMGTDGFGTSDDGRTFGIVKVKTNGVLSVDKFFYSWSNGFNPDFLGNVEIVLAPAVQQKILWDIIALSDAKIKTTYSRIVCMMMPAPGPDMALIVRTGHSYENDKFSGVLRVVESNTGCWAHSHTGLVNDYDRQTAAGLMSALQVLTMQLGN